MCQRVEACMRSTYKYVLKGNLPRHLGKSPSTSPSTPRLPGRQIENVTRDLATPGHPIVALFVYVIVNTIL